MWRPRLCSVDGQSIEASFNSPTHITVDSAGILYVTEYGSSKIRKITPARYVSTYAGTGSRGQTDGPRLSASFD